MGAIVAEVADARATLFEPSRRRGAARNFNLLFDEAEAEYVSLLEDDNWWEPSFLATMLAALVDRPEFGVVVGNERPWKELPGGGWRPDGDPIWPFRDVRAHGYGLEEICGSAKLCNSAMLFDLGRCGRLRTPDTIPVDVTEHFRERLLSGGVLLHGAPLVNYAQTLATARSTRGALLGRIPKRLADRQRLHCDQLAVKEAPAASAPTVGARCPSPTSPRAVTLVAAGLCLVEARALITEAPRLALARFAIWAVFAGRCSSRNFWKAAIAQAGHLAFLVEAPLTRRLAGELD